MDVIDKQVGTYLNEQVRENGAMTGAQLSKQVRDKFPQFDHIESGYASFTQMVSRLSELTILEKRGSDLLWGYYSPDIVPFTVVDVPIDSLEDDWTDGLSAEGLIYDKIEFRGFKGLLDVDIQLDKLTLLVGQNGTGKTSILHGLSLMHKVCNIAPRSVLRNHNDPNKLRSRGEFRDMEIRLCDTKSDVSVELSCKWRNRSDTDFSTRIRLMRGSDSIEYESGPNMPDRRLGGTVPVEALSPMMFLKLDGRRIARSSWSDLEAPIMDYDGYGLPSVLAHMATVEPEELDSIMSSVGRIVPGFNRVRMPRKKMGGSPSPGTDRPHSDSQWGHRLEVKMHDHWLEAHLLSEGTLLALALFTFLQASKGLRFLLLDDIDRALHPKAQSELVAVLSEIQKTHPLLQLVCTSHSPHLLDHVKAESVRVMTNDKKGWSKCRKLTDHPDWNEWKDSLETGEFWSYVGEDWEER